MDKLNITLVQTNIFWEQIDSNLNMLQNKLKILKYHGDIIVLPEMFSTGFSMNTSLAERLDGKSVKWMEKMASEYNCVITGSLMIKEGIQTFNRLVWMRPDGSFETYNKRHLFRMMDEDKYFAPGSKRIIIEYQNWRICPQICYDMRFPVWSRNKNDYDILLYVANWPEIRQTAWKDLLKGRAHENQCYVIGVNRVGKDGRDIPFSGNSAVVGPKGENLWKAKSCIEQIKNVAISMNELEDYRAKFPQYLDADEFSIEGC